MTDPRIEAIIRHDMENVWGMQFDEWREKRPRAYAIRVADAERLLAAADAVDPLRQTAQAGAGGCKCGKPLAHLDADEDSSEYLCRVPDFGQRPFGSAS